MPIDATNGRPASLGPARRAARIAARSAAVELRRASASRRTRRSARARRTGRCPSPDCLVAGTGCAAIVRSASGLDVALEQLPEVHPVEMVAGEDQDSTSASHSSKCRDRLAHGVGRALEPVARCRRLLGGEDLDEAVARRGRSGRSAAMWRLSDAELNCVRTKMRRSSACRQLLIGMSMSRYLPPIGTAGFDRAWVSGKSRVPRPPPRMMTITSCMPATLGDCLRQVQPPATVRRPCDAAREELTRLSPSRDPGVTPQAYPRLMRVPLASANPAGRCPQR